MKIQGIINRNSSGNEITSFPVTGRNISHSFPLKTVMSSVLSLTVSAIRALDPCLMRSALGLSLNAKEKWNLTSILTNKLQSFSKA